MVYRVYLNDKFYQYFDTKWTARREAMSILARGNRMGTDFDNESTFLLPSVENTLVVLAYEGRRFRWI
jgi:hypothetical protein